MPLPLDSLEAGKCYVTERGQVRRVVEILRDGRVRFENRRPLPQGGFRWLAAIQDRRSLAAILEREVPADWTGGRGNA